MSLLSWAYALIQSRTQQNTGQQHLYLESISRRTIDDGTSLVDASSNIANYLGTKHGKKELDKSKLSRCV